MNPDFDIVRIYQAFRYSLSGIRFTFVRERAFRQECFMAIILIPLALHLGKTGMEKAVLILSIIAVMVVELVNTAVETIIERISPEWHVLSGAAKDIGAAAVLMSIVGVVATWCLILF